MRKMMVFIYMIVFIYIKHITEKLVETCLVKGKILELKAHKFLIKYVISI